MFDNRLQQVVNYGVSLHTLDVLARGLSEEVLNQIGECKTPNEAMAIVDRHLADAKAILSQEDE